MFNFVPTAKKGFLTKPRQMAMVDSTGEMVLLTRRVNQEMVTLDYLYVTNWSLWGDVRLILKTLPLVARGHGR